MKAVRISRTGGPEVLEYVDVPDPSPERGQAVVTIEAVGVNYADTYTRSGLYLADLPLVLGVEAAGKVSAVSEDVTQVQVGDRVAYTGTMGSYAESAAVPAQRLVKVPSKIKLETAAAVMSQGLTAHYLAHSILSLDEDCSALIHAGAGGVGLLLIQMAKRLGAHVLTTVSTDEKAALAHDAGADRVILYTRQDFEEEVRKATDGEGVHVAYDAVGKDTFQKSMNCLRRRGYLVYYGQSSGLAAPIDPSVLGRGSFMLTRPRLDDFVATRGELLQRANDVFEWIQSGDLKVRIHDKYPLKGAEEAHFALEGRETMGKLLLIP